MSDKVLVVITARGGSKGVPRKNIRLVGGKPLIAYTIETALAARHLLYRIIVSTDDEEIAQVARQYGAEGLYAPVGRPATGPSLTCATSAPVEEQDNTRMDWVLPSANRSMPTVEDIACALNWLALAVAIR